MPPILGLNMNAETKLFEANGERTQNLEFLYRALMTGKPTSVTQHGPCSLKGVFQMQVFSRLKSDPDLVTALYATLCSSACTSKEKNVSRGNSYVSLTYLSMCFIKTTSESQKYQRTYIAFSSGIYLKIEHNIIPEKFPGSRE